MSARGCGVTSPKASERFATHGDGDLLSEVFHGISQPLTALECGLELSLRQDKDSEQLRARVKAALESAQILHQRVVVLRMLLDAGDPGDTSAPVAIDGLLRQLRDDFVSLADATHVRLSMRCKPAFVQGNADRFRSGFFHLFESVIGRSLPHRTVCVSASLTRNGFFEVRFAVVSRPCPLQSKTTQTENAGDLGFRIARRTFQASGGELVLRFDTSEQIDGHVLPRLANL
jgi:hypothetical protein